MKQRICSSCRAISRRVVAVAGAVDGRDALLLAALGSLWWGLVQWSQALAFTGLGLALLALWAVVPWSWRR